MNSIIVSYYVILKVLGVYNQKRVLLCSNYEALRKPKYLIASARYLRFLSASQGNIPKISI